MSHTHTRRSRARATSPFGLLTHVKKYHERTDNRKKQCYLAGILTEDINMACEG